MSAAGLPVFLLGIGVLSAQAQVQAQAQPLLAFEVASVKLSPPREGVARFISMDTDPGMVRYSNITLGLLISLAYRIDTRGIQGGPAWLEEQLYDLSAKLPPGAAKDRIPAMLQKLLAERFQLGVHRETKEQRAYFLVAVKSGARLKPAQPPEERDAQQVRGDRLAAQIIRGGITGHTMAMGPLAATLAHVLGYQVVDRTGLTGVFDIDLKWTPEDSKEAGPSLFTAIQEQLGLKLEPGKAPVEVLVVDHAERVPIEN